MQKSGGKVVEKPGISLFFHPMFSTSQATQIHAVDKTLSYSQVIRRFFHYFYSQYLYFYYLCNQRKKLFHYYLKSFDYKNITI